MASTSEQRQTKQPRKIIHFSDGQVAEYSTDEEECGESNRSQKIVQIDPTSFGWMEWIRFKSIVIGNATLNVCDYLGDSLSSFFGITTPKYQFEIDHYNTMKQLEKEISDTEMGINDGLKKNAANFVQ